MKKDQNLFEFSQLDIKSYDIGKNSPHFKCIYQVLHISFCNHLSSFCYQFSQIQHLTISQFEIQLKYHNNIQLVTMPQDRPFISLNESQRGIIFLWFLSIIIFLVNIVVQIIKKTLQTNLGLRQQEEGENSGKNVPSAQNFNNREIHESPNHPPVNENPQRSTLENVGQKTTKIYTNMAIMTLVLLCIVTSTSYVFSLTWMFFVLGFFIIFNQLKLYNRCTNNRIVRVICQSLWLVAAWFWTLNIWVIIPEVTLAYAKVPVA